jgi:hypothetical protein
MANLGDRRRDRHACAGSRVEGEPADVDAIDFGPHEQVSAGRLFHFESLRAGRTKLGIARGLESGFKRIVRRCRGRTHVVDFVGIGRAAQVVDRVLRQHHA